MVIVSMAVGAFVFLVTELAGQPVIWNLTMATFLGGITIVIQLLMTFETRLGRTEVGYHENAKGMQRLFEQRDEDTEQLRLFTRYFEEQIPRVISDALDTKQREEPLVRELVHALNTPLAQMEATLLAYDNETVPPSAVSDIVAGIRVCKSFLAAFRQVATLAEDKQAWEPASIEETIAAAARLYAARAEHQPGEIRLPKDVPGYGKNYIVALLLPLIENAFEATPKGGRIAITMRLAADSYLLDVVNDSAAGVTLKPDIYGRNWSSKPGHEGLGLATVKNLLAAHRDASLTHSIDGSNRVTFTVRLPRREA